MLLARFDIEELSLDNLFRIVELREVMTCKARI